MKFKFEDLKNCLTYLYNIVFTEHLLCVHPIADFDFLTYAFKVRNSGTFSYFDYRNERNSHPEEGYILVSMTDLGPEFYFSEELDSKNIISVSSTKNYQEFKQGFETLYDWFEFKSEYKFDFNFIVIFQMLKYLMKEDQIFELESNIIGDHVKIDDNDLYRNLLVVKTTLRDRDINQNTFRFYVRNGIGPDYFETQIFVNALDYGKTHSWSYNQIKDYECLYSYSYSRYGNSLVERIMEEAINKFWLPF